MMRRAKVMRANIYAGRYDRNESKYDELETKIQGILRGRGAGDDACGVMQ